MATQTRFDLNTAVENWRNELAAQPQLTPDDRRELEKHLADSMAELRGRGLNEEESFWLARKRIGQPQQLAEEFEKADPNKVWRERVFWMAAGMMIFWQLALIIAYSEGIVFAFNSSLYQFYQHNWGLFSSLPILLGGILLAKGFIGRSLKSIWFFQNRFRLALLLIFLPFLCDFLQLASIRAEDMEAGRNYSASWGAWWETYFLHSVSYLKFSAAPLILIIWLLPKQNRKAAKTA